MNTIIIELCQEDRQRLDAILEALKERPNCERCANAVASMVNPALEARQETANAPEVTEPTPEPEQPAAAPVAEPAKVVELVDIQRKVVELSTAGKKAEVREIVTRYADRVSGIPESARAEVWDLLNKLEG